MQPETTACFTGYRPKKLSWGDDESDPRCAALKIELVNAIRAAYARGYRTFISGMALGVDIYAAEETLTLRAELDEIELVCAIPYPGYALRVPHAQRARYETIILGSARCAVSADSYRANCMWLRNKYMVDHSSLVIAVYDGKLGGTHNTVTYAKQTGRDVVFIVPE